MAIRPEFRWWILTLVVVGVLLVISALALDRPNVVWEGETAACPHCRTAVPSFSSRCATCDQRYDWTSAPDDTSPRSPWSLSASEAQYVRERVESLGDEAAAARVAKTMEISPTAATEYLDHVGRGRCGWCGGTGRDLAAPTSENEPCPVCFGKKACIACGGDRRIRVGDEGAHRAIRAYRQGIDGVSIWIPAAVQREEAEALNRKFLQLHAGTAEAVHLDFWPGWPQHKESRAVRFSRGRLDALLTALSDQD